MSEDKTPLVPELRFPEFEGEWKNSTIGKVGSFYYGKSAPKWSLEPDAPTPCVRYGELYTKFGATITETYSRTNVDPSKLRFSKGGEVLVPRVGERPEEFGKCVSYLAVKDVAIGEMISVFDTPQDSLFYTYYFRSMFKQFAKVVEGQNVKNLYFAELEPLEIGIPTLPEQQKIAECLSSLDDLIKAEGERLEALRTHKKGLMQNLFPRAGETTPRLRFPEFQGSGEWELFRLNDIAPRVRERVEASALDETNYISTENLLPNFMGVKKSNSPPSSGTLSAFLLGDILSSNIRPYLNKVWHSDRNGGASNDVLVFRAGERINNTFLSFILKNEMFISYVMEGAKGVKMPRGDINSIENYPIAVPKIESGEQHRIAECLSSLDGLITAQSDKIGALELHKKGLMQGLFPETGDRP